ncbi:MAG: Gfo/Idh/MocA family oxidoreductase [Saprospiraceae bacterium]
MRPISLFLFLFTCSIAAYSQTWYVAVVEGKVLYNNAPLKPKDKIEMGGTLKFSSQQDYIKVSGPGGLHTLRPEERPARRSNELLVAIREELLPSVRFRATVANNIIWNPCQYYFGFESMSRNYFNSVSFSIEDEKLAHGEQLYIVHDTPKGLHWRHLPVVNNHFTFDATTFSVSDESGNHLSIDSSAVILVRDTLVLKTSAVHPKQHLHDLVPIADVHFKCQGMIVIPLIHEDSIPPAPKPLEILDYLQPFYFTDRAAFFSDMRSHIQYSGATSSQQFLHEFYYDEYISEVYGNPVGYSDIIEALVPEPYQQYNNIYYSEAWRETPLRIGVVGLVHTHVHGLLDRYQKGEVQLVGIVEPNKELAQRYSEQYGFPMDMVYDSMEELMAFGDPELVAGFNATFDHLALVEYFAPRKVHIMVEKPMAVNLDHARRMVALANHYYIELLTNYETSWYSSNQYAFEQIESGNFGTPNRLIFNTGHQEPQEIGCNTEFLEWLTDPVQNGGGALPDFACYGANITTQLLQGATPEKVTCLTRQTKPERYPLVEDDATIILDYPKGVSVVIQASWNWSHNRKEMELYVPDGYIICTNATDVTMLRPGTTEAESITRPVLSPPYDDPFRYITAIIKQGLAVPEWGVSTMANNLRVSEILAAARYAATQGRTVTWEEAMQHGQ